MLHEGVQNSADTERGLDDVGSELAHVLSPCPFLNDDKVFGDLDRARANTSDLESDATLVVELFSQSLSLFLGGGLNGSLDYPPVLLEMGSELLLVQIDLPLLDNDGLGKPLPHKERRAGFFCVDAQIVGATIGAAYTLDPAV